MFMSKTHWLAFAQVLATAAHAAGFIPTPTYEFISYILGGSMVPTLTHRAVKLYRGTAQP